MKKIKKSLLFVIFGALLVTSCDPNSSSSYEDNMRPNYPNRAIDDSFGMSALTSVGEQKLLVVPVVFSNTHVNATPENKAMLEKVFFGDASETGWESLASYYEKSSYGKLTLTGGVGDYFYLDYSTFELVDKHVDATQKYGEGHYWDQSHYVIEDIYNTYDAEFLKEYDLDGDGFVDALWMVYMADINAAGTDNSVFWAYKFYWNREPNVEKPTPNVYAWASYTFAKDGAGYTYEKPDAHTFIHETGHLLGLPDYYDYDTRGGMQLTNPSGGVDMMAYNIGDHSSYSKYRYNWIEPKEVNHTREITIAPFESSGDVVLVKNGWNGHAYDEYLLFDYYTPTGLNKKDSEGRGYASDRNQSSGTKTFTVPGVRIWHVDSRLLNYVFDEEEELVTRTWTDEITGTEYSFTDVGPSNTASRSHGAIVNGVEEDASTYKLLHLLNAAGQTGKVGNWLKAPAVSGNEALFQTGDVIAADGWEKYLQYSADFNDGTPVGYSVEIGEMTEEGVTLKFVKA